MESREAASVPQMLGTWYQLDCTCFLLLGLSLSPVSYLFFLSNLFILREKQSKWGRGTERGRERNPNRLRPISVEPSAGLELINHEVMTWAEIRSQMLN